jgi:hypothetical protein
MLQIITGRFFGSGKVNEQEFEDILYSNYSWIAPIKTDVMELRPVDTHNKRVSSYVVRYTSRYEQTKGDILIMPLSYEPVEQFRLFASLYFRAFFHVDRRYVESLCRTEPVHVADTNVPKNFVPKFFDLQRTGTNDETVGFAPFMKRVLGISRKNYRLLVSCVAGFFEALEAIGQNFDLAYSIMVYTLEALSTSHEQPKPAWDDYDQNLRTKLDQLLLGLDSQIANGVRDILLQNPHIKLKKRFIEFVKGHLADAYFTTEAEDIRFAPAKSELERALANLYDARSGYVHSLKQVQYHLRLQLIGTSGDVYTWQNEPYFTFAGLVRLVSHVLTSFIGRQLVTPNEEYPQWRDELPNVIRVPLAPEYWVWPPQNFVPSVAPIRLSGFLDYYVANINNPLLDLRPLMARIEECMPTSTAADRHTMLALYFMFTGMIPDSHCPQRERFLSKWGWEQDLQRGSIELMAICVLWGNDLLWPIGDCVKMFETYQRARYKTAALRLPRRLEIAIMCCIANLFLKTNDPSNFVLWIERGIADLAGNKASQTYLRECRDKSQPADPSHILGRSPTTGKEKFTGSDQSPTGAEQIRKLAYLKWEQAGKPEGDGIEFWLEAERELRGR